MCFVADESTLRQYRSKLSRGPSKSRQVSYLSLPRLQETSIAMRFRCTFASCVAWRCLTMTKRDFIVLAVRVSPCVGFAVTGNTAGAKQVLRRHLGGDQKPWVILEKQVEDVEDQESPRSFTLPLISILQISFWHFYTFLSCLSVHGISKALRVASLHASLFVCLDMRICLVGIKLSSLCVHDVCKCVSLCPACICTLGCFLFFRSTWHLRGDFWGVWQLSLRGLSSPVTSSALDEIRRETSHDFWRKKKKTFWNRFFEKSNKFPKPNEWIE